MGRKGKQIITESRGRRGEQLFEEDYEVLKSFILEKLENGPMPVQDLEKEIQRLFDLAFEDDVLWLTSVILEDLEVRGLIREERSCLSLI